MDKKLDFENKLKKMMKSRVNESFAQNLDFLPEGKKCTWMNAICISLACKAAKGDIQAIKYINEICQKNDDEKENEPFTLTVKVVE